MKTFTQQFGTSQKIIALAILGVFGSAQAADDMAQYTKPDSSITVGATAVSGDDKDRAISGLYNGMRDHNGYLNLDVDYLRRNDATGTWTSVKGRNLGLDNRDLGVAMQKQGDWKVTGDYSELHRRDMRSINTADTGVGSATPTIVRLATPGTGSDVNLELKRIGLGLGVEKWFSPSFMVEASFKNEDKDGARFWGRGYDCAGYVCSQGALPATSVKNAILMMAEPVNFNTKQFELKLNFNDEKLNLSAGYYGSFFTNGQSNLTATVPNILNNGLGNAATLYGAVPGTVIAGGGTSLQNVLQLPMALPPDNQAHQFSIAGNYAFTPTTKGTFKYAFTRATQDQDFGAMGLANAPAGRSNLGGQVDNTLFQFGLTAKPIAKLSLLANVRYEKKDDQTPDAAYNLESRTATPIAVPQYTNDPQNGVASATWDNNHVSNTKFAAKFEASYLLPQNVRATLGVDHNTVERMVPKVVAASANEEQLAGLGPLREKTEETGYRLELRRAIAETLTGAIGYSQSKRTGSDWSSLSTLDPIQLNAVIADPLATAAQKTTARANLLLVNAYCGGRSCYGQQLSEGAILGLSRTTLFPKEMTNLDREKWKLSANWTPLEKLSLQFSVEQGKDKNGALTDAVQGGRGYRGTDVAFYNIDADYAVNDNWKVNGYYSYGEQGQQINHSVYMLDLTNKNSAFGLGLLGKVSGKLELGANLTYLNDVSNYGLSAQDNAVVPATANNLAQAAIGLPDVTFRQTTLSLFGKYALDKSADIRVSLVHQRSMLKEWSWANNGVPFTYADNTTVSLKEQQNVTYLGAAYIYKFQ